MPVVFFLMSFKMLRPDLSVHVDQRASAIAWIYWRVGLNP
jgi:hypothetical protein